MEPVAATCYTRLEQRIRTMYRKIGDFGGSILGRIALSCLAEYGGSWLGEYAAGTMTFYVEDVSSRNPLITRAVLASTGAVVLCGVVRGRRYQRVTTTPHGSLAAGLIGAAYLNVVWNFAQLFPYVLYVNQIMGRILGGYVGLVLTGVVPVFYEKTHWRSCYLMRMVRLESVSLMMTHRTVAYVSMQFFAYHVDWLIPYGQECRDKMRLANQQIIPLLLANFVANLASQKRKERQRYIEEITNAFSKRLKKSLTILFPPIYYLTCLGKVTLSQKRVDQLVQHIDQRVKKGIQQGVSVGVNRGEQLVQEKGELFVRWGLRTLARFGRLFEKSNEMQHAHIRWKEAFLDQRWNDLELARQDLVKEIDYVLGRTYKRYRIMHKVIEKICQSHHLAKEVAKSLQEIPHLEKQLLGCALSEPLHIKYWEGMFDVYVSRFFTLACLHSRELRDKKMPPSEDKKLMQYIEAFVCHAYLDVVFSKQSHPWIRKGVHTVASKAHAIQENLLHCVCENQQAWVDVEDDLDYEDFSEDHETFCLVETDEDYVFAGGPLDEEGGS